jgi:hypothetical protein
MATWAGRAESLPARGRVSNPHGLPARARRTPRRGLAGGIVWIALVAALLAGVVALNVAVLRLNMRLEQLGRERVDLRAENALLSAQVSTTLGQRRIGSLAEARLRLVPAKDATYVDLAEAR